MSYLYLSCNVLCLICGVDGMSPRSSSSKSKDFSGVFLTLNPAKSFGVEPLLLGGEDNLSDALSAIASMIFSSASSFGWSPDKRRSFDFRGFAGVLKSSSEVGSEGILSKYAEVITFFLLFFFSFDSGGDFFCNLRCVTSITTFFFFATTAFVPAFKDGFAGVDCIGRTTGLPANCSCIVFNWFGLTLFFFAHAFRWTILPLIFRELKSLLHMRQNHCSSIMEP